MAVLSESVTDTSDVQNLPERDRAALAWAAAPTLPTEQQQELAAELGQPDQRVTNFIWGVLVVAVALVLVGSVGAMIWVFTRTGQLDPGAMLTVFTTVMGFVAGLLIKSPVTA